MKVHTWCSILLLVCLSACQGLDNQQNLINEVSPDLQGQWINMVVEIPTGSTEKWEVNKQTGLIEPDSLDGAPRIIKYLGYPGNYGFIPQTLLPKAQGGDGDPLDILVIGDPAERGSVIRCRVLGMLKLTDTGEMDDKLIALAEDSPLSHIESLAELATEMPRALEIIESWFTNYKGAGKMESRGYAEWADTEKVIRLSMAAF